MTKGRILIVSFSYRPVVSPRAFRWSSIAESWADRYEVDVLCAQRGNAPAEEYCNGVHVYRVQGGLLGALRSRIAEGPRRGQDSRAASAEKPHGERGLGLFRKVLFAARGLLFWTYDHTWKQVWWPDHAGLWYFPAVRKARELFGQSHYDALITSSHPFTDHIVGLKIKRLFPSVRWIVDIGDPFCFADEMPLNNFSIYRRLNRTVEKRVFETADHVVVTNSRTAERYREAFGEPACRNISVIGPAIPTSCLGNAAELAGVPLPSEQINVVFTGNLINPVRRPRDLMAWMKNVAQRWNATSRRRLVFHLFGDSASGIQAISEAAGVDEGVVQCHGRVPRPKAIAALQAAQFVLNCGNITDYQLPSKVYEYMATGKPIVNVVFNRHDASIKALSEYPRVVHCDGQAPPDDALLAFFQEHASKGEATVPASVAALIEEHLVPRIASRYEALLQ